MERLERILLVCSTEPVRLAAYFIIKIVESFGYAVDLCNAGGKTPVKADKLLDSDSGVARYAGVVILDSGGDTKAAVEMAKRADKAKLAIGGHGEGCLILHLAGLLKDKFVCAGLPDEINKKAKAVNSPSVRSDNVVTALGDCTEGFAMLMVDAMGGKIKKVVHSTSATELPGQTAMVIDSPFEWPRYWRLARSMSLGGKVAIAAWEGVDARAGTAANCVVLDAEKSSVRRIDSVAMPRSLWLRQRSINAVEALAKLEQHGFRNVNSARAHEMASRGDLSMLEGLVEIDGPGEEVVCSASRTPSGWMVTNVAANRVLDEAQLSSVIKTSEITCTAFQAAMENPNEVNELGIVIRLNDDAASVSRLDPIAPVAPPPEPERLSKRQRWIIERELANDGIFLQPDGNVALKSGGHIEKLSPEMAVQRLQKSALEAANAEHKNRGEPDEMRRWGLAGRIARHKLRCLCALMSITGENTRTAGLYDSGATGWYSNLDLPMFERVWEWNEEDDFLKDRDKAIRNLPRYNPEYDQNGFYFVWNEPRREPTSWQRILDGDSVYPARKALQRR